jgi:hypothetical protein
MGVLRSLYLAEKENESSKTLLDLVQTPSPVPGLSESRGYCPAPTRRSQVVAHRRETQVAPNRCQRTPLDPLLFLGAAPNADD